jgi:hypothetical protein
MYLGATEAELLEARDGVIRFQAAVTMTPEEKVAADGDIERLNEMLEQKRGVPVPVPPGPNYIFNREGLNTQILQGTVQAGAANQLIQLGQKLARLNRDLAAAEQAKGGRGILIRALKAQIVQVTERMAAIEHQEGSKENSNQKDRNDVDNPT